MPMIDCWLQNLDLVQTLYNSYKKGGLPQGGSRIYFGGAKPRFLIESYGRSPYRGREAPEYRGRSRVEGAKRPRIEGEARNRGRSREKSGGGVWEGARWAPPQKIFEKSTTGSPPQDAEPPPKFKAESVSNVTSFVSLILLTAILFTAI